jgi:hypothetical protein
MQIGPAGGSPLASTPTFYGTSVKRTATQSILAGTPTLITWQAAVYDTTSSWSAFYLSRINIGTTGYYLVRLCVVWPSGADQTYRNVYICKNSEGNPATAAIAYNGIPALVALGVYTINECSNVVALTAGDYVEGFCVQGSAGALAIGADDIASLSVAFLGE